MKIFFIIFDAIIIVFALYVLALKGRTKNKNIDKFLKWRYAHRGLHQKPTVPENSLAAFKAAVEKGYAIELDVHLMRDGNIAVIHDSSLKRTAGYDVKIEDLTISDLEKFKLEESNEKIPTLKQVLELVDGKVPLLVEIKTENNCAAVTKRTIEILKGYEGEYLIESFDPRCILWLKKHAPNIVRGQLTQNFIKEKIHYNENSPINQFRAALGLNKQGTITSKVTMYANPYPFDSALKFFGAVKDYGAQPVK